MPTTFRLQPEDMLGLASLSALPPEQGFVDLFSGAGGLTIGFARAGLRPLCSVDNSPSVRETHAWNYPTIPFFSGDLSKPITLDPALASLAGASPMVVLGGPPCQGFSIFGKRRFVNSRGYQPRQDPRNRLVYSFVDAIARIRPRWFLMENVPGLASLEHGAFLEALLREFREMGFSRVEHRILNCASHGVPQIRRRLIVLGNRTGHVIPWPKPKFFETPKEWQDGFRTVGEVITDLADPASHKVHSCHVPMNHKPLLVERYRFIPEGGKLDVEALPARLRKGYRTDAVKNYSHVFRRLHRERASTTMVPGHNAFPIHPWLDRALTVREAARIQTFPDEVEFRGSRQEQCIQVGNAFPPLVAELLANNIVKAERNGWFAGQVPPSAKYALLDLSQEDEQPPLIANL
jgi:DNA (cytosine-5)-methyltransferase 1